MKIQTLIQVTQAYVLPDDPDTHPLNVQQHPNRILQDLFHFDQEGHG